MVGWLVARSDLVTAGVVPSTFRDAFLRYDGGFYWVITRGGYPECPGATFNCVEVRRFFPGFAMVAHVVELLTPFGSPEALLIVSNLGAVAAMFAVWRVLQLIEPWPSEMSRRPSVPAAGVWLLALYPASSVMAAAYAESLAVLATAAFVLALHRRSFVSALLVGLAVGLIRPTGVLMVVLVAVSWWMARGQRDERRTSPDPPTWSTARWAAVAAAPVVGLASYLAYLQIDFGDPGAPLTLQRQLRGGFREPITRLLGALWRTVTDDFRDAYNVVFAIAMIVLIVLAATRFRRRIPVAWTATAAVGLAVALSANNIDSLGRYMLAVFPAWLGALALVATSRRWLLVSAIGVMSVGYVWMTATTLRVLVVP